MKNKFICKTKTKAIKLQSRYEAIGARATQNVRNYKPMWELVLDNLRHIERTKNNYNLIGLTVQDFIAKLRKKNFRVNEKQASTTFQMLKNAGVVSSLPIPDFASQGRRPHMYFLTGIF